MSTTGAAGAAGSLPTNFILSPHQQDLLFAALNSNTFNDSNDKKPIDSLAGNVEESPYLDFDYDLDAGDNGYDIPHYTNMTGQMMASIPRAASSSDGDTTDIHDKRSHPDEEDDGDEGGGKRREGDDKGAKKPGRKPLTSEPTTKRKAQNRAAQRAFRERKEKHLKDMETKIQDLEKASESANQENAILRAQLEQMASELKEYRKKVSLSGSTNRSSPTALPSYMSGKGFENALNNPNDVNFQFEFPQFGKLPGPSVLNSTASTNSQPASQHRDSNDSGISPLQAAAFRNADFATFTDNLGMPFSNSIDGQVNNTPSTSDLFDLSMFSSINKDFAATMQRPTTSAASRSSSDSVHGRSSAGNETSHSSPSASSNSAISVKNGASSSCGTSPEPLGSSPKQSGEAAAASFDTKASSPAAGEQSFCDRLSMACGNPNQPIPRTMSDTTAPSVFGQYKPFGTTPGLEFGSFDWLAQQNGNTFEPELFGDYREPQDNILAGNGLYDDSFFSEALNLDQFNSPAATELSPRPVKKDLVSQIDDKLNAEDEVVPGDSQMLTCNSMWEKIQNCPSVQNGEIDMDQLCSQLQQKAKCSGGGPVIDEKDFKSVIKSMFPADQPCPLTK